MGGALGLGRMRGVVGRRGGLDVAAREGGRGEAVAVVEALKDEVGGGAGEGVAQAAEDDGAYGVVEAGAYLEEGEEVGCREGFEDEGEDLAWLATGWGEGERLRTSLGKAPREAGEAASPAVGIVERTGGSWEAIGSLESWWWEEMGDATYGA